MRDICFLLIICGIALGISCSKQEQEIPFIPLIFPDSTHLEGTILDSVFVMGMSYDIDYYNQYIVVSAHCGEREPLIHLFDLDEKRFFKSLLPKGRGPGERLTWGGIQVDHSSGEGLFFDSDAQKIITFNIDSVRHSKKKWEEQVVVRNHPFYAYDVVKRKDGYITYGGGEGVSPTGEYLRFALLKNDSIIDKYYKTPVIHFSENYPTIKKFSTDFKFSVSPDKQKIVCARNYCVLLELFRIEDNRIIADTVQGFVRPLVGFDRYNCIIPVIGKTVFGFDDLYATNQYIYTIYGGNTAVKSYRIAVFDWKGNPLHLFTTDYVLEHLCVDEANKKIYATGVTPQFENVLLEFPLLLDSLK